MKKVFGAIMALVFACGVSFAAGSMDQQGGGTGGAGSDQEMMEQQQGGGTGGAEMGEEKTMTATVQDVNKDQKMITVTNDQGQTMQLTLNDDTKIMGADGQEKKVGDLKSGSQVKVTYTGSEENPNVTKVEVSQGQQ